MCPNVVHCYQLGSRKCQRLSRRCQVGVGWYNRDADGVALDDADLDHEFPSYTNTNGLHLYRQRYGTKGCGAVVPVDACHNLTNLSLWSGLEDDFLYYPVTQVSAMLTSLSIFADAQGEVPLGLQHVPDTGRERHGGLHPGRDLHRPHRPHDLAVPFETRATQSFSTVVDCSSFTILIFENSSPIQNRVRMRGV